MEDYKVLKAIGKGSFGKVYLVRHVKEGKTYVLKVIKVKGMSLKDRFVAVFHPHLVLSVQGERKRTWCFLL